MGVEACNGRMRCNTSASDFGPKFRDDDDVYEFLAWIEQGGMNCDPRTLHAPLLAGLVELWIKAHPRIDLGVGQIISGPPLLQTMTVSDLRNYLAGQALAGAIANEGVASDVSLDLDTARIARASYAYADAMLAEREKTPGPTYDSTSTSP